MHNINLDDATIEFEGEWLSAQDITRKIEANIAAGQMKFAGLAAALEALNQALENSRQLAIKMVLNTNDYELLKSRGQGNDRECLRKAIAAFILNARRQAADHALASRQNKAPDKGGGAKTGKIKCVSCGKPIEVSLDQSYDEIHCSHCGARGLLKPRATD